jgi:hypothetical protein
VLGLSLAVLVATPAAARMQLLSQARSVRTTIARSVQCAPEPPWPFTCASLYASSQGPLNENHLEQAVTFEPFQQEVTTAASSAAQDSSFGPGYISASGSISAGGLDETILIGNTLVWVIGSTTSHSAFSAQFSLDHPTEVMLSAQVDGAEAPTQLMTLHARLFDASGTIAGLVCGWTTEDEIVYFCHPEAEAWTGVLAPGQYTLEAYVDGEGYPQISGQSSGHGASGSYAITLSATAPVPLLGPPGLALLALLMLAAVWCTGRRVEPVA